MVSITQDSIHLSCYFDGEVSGDDRESMSLVHTYVLSDFPDGHSTTLSIERIDYPQALPHVGECVYFRKEADLDD